MVCSVGMVGVVGVVGPLPKEVADGSVAASCDCSCRPFPAKPLSEPTDDGFPGRMGLLIFPLGNLKRPWRYYRSTSGL